MAMLVERLFEPSNGLVWLIRSRFVAEAFWRQNGFRQRPSVHGTLWRRWIGLLCPPAFAALAAYFAACAERCADMSFRCCRPWTQMALMLLPAVDTEVGTAALTNSAKTQLSAMATKFVEWHCLSR